MRWWVYANFIGWSALVAGVVSRDTQVAMGVGMTAFLLLASIAFMLDAWSNKP